MRTIRYLFVFIMIFGFASYAFAEEDYDGKLEDREMDALRKWIREKRLVTVKEIGGDLSLSGEIHYSFKGSSEEKNGQQQRGPHGATTVPIYNFDIEGDIVLDYQAPRAWASMQLEFANSMGQISGTTNRISLDRAYFGGRIIDRDTFSFVVEAGRRNLGSVYESKVQYSSLMDGLLLQWNKSTEKIGDLFFNLGGFIVNDSENQFAYAAELGMVRVLNTGFYSKLSFIDWKKNISEYEIRNLRYNFRIGQALLGYQSYLQGINKYCKLYLAGLYNFVAKRLTISDNKKAAWGAYLGGSIGQVRKQGDWAFDMNFQAVAAQAIPDFDSGGIKRGNAAKVGFYTADIKDTVTPPVPTTQATAVGNGNFKGIQGRVLYGMTNNLTMLNSVKMSNNLNFDIGPKLEFFEYKLEFVYAY